MVEAYCCHQGGPRTASRPGGTAGASSAASTAVAIQGRMVVRRMFTRRSSITSEDRALRRAGGGLRAWGVEAIGASRTHFSLASLGARERYRAGTFCRSCATAPRARPPWRLTPIP